jgi:hypothetical protein
MKVQFFQRGKYLFLLVFLIYLIGCVTIKNEPKENEINIVIEVEFFNYIENSIEFLTDYDDGDFFWVDTIDMRILSGEYKDKEIRLIIGENPIRNEFIKMGRYYVKINKEKLENFINNDHSRYRSMPIFSGNIEFINK